MKAVFLVCFLFVTVFANPIPEKVPVSILTSVNRHNGSQGYEFSYTSSDGMQRTEQGVPRDPKDPNSSLIVTGSYTYFGDKNVIYLIKYVADENGYRIISNLPLNY